MLHFGVEIGQTRQALSNWVSTEMLDNTSGSYLVVAGYVQNVKDSSII